MIHPSIAHLARPIDSVVLHPANPRRGNVKVIAESLRVNGQFKPIIVQAGTDIILGGNHTYKAAVSLGWDEIAVVEVDVDDARAAAVVLADNRHGDLADYDDFALADLLESVPSLEGTGYTDDFLTKLRADLDTPLDANVPPDGDEKAKGPDRCGVITPSFTIILPPGALAGLAADLKGRAGRDRLAERLQFPQDVPDVKGKFSRPGQVQRLATDERTVVQADRIPIGDVVPYPGNPRQGDVGAIAESLAANGQFRPIVVNRRTGECLAGNHTLFAARALGWTDIAATFVDVDEADAARIVLADNRTSDAGHYDLDVLLATLQAVPSLEGTGYTFDDLDAMIAQATGAGGEVVRKGRPRVSVFDDTTAVKVGLTCAWGLYDVWRHGLGDDPGGEVLARLDIDAATRLPEEAWT